MSGESDPNANLFGDGGPESGGRRAIDFVYGNNPNRVAAMSDLWYDEMSKHIDSMNLRGKKREEMLFKLTAQAVLDMLGDSNSDASEEVLSNFDMFLGLALTNKRFGVNLLEEQNKALEGMPARGITDGEELARMARGLADEWWEKVPQPALDGRTANDAIVETLRRYGLDG